MKRNLPIPTTFFGCIIVVSTRWISTLDWWSWRVCFRLLHKHKVWSEKIRWNYVVLNLPVKINVRSDWGFNNSTVNCIYTTESHLSMFVAVRIPQNVWWSRRSAKPKIFFVFCVLTVNITQHWICTRENVK